MRLYNVTRKNILSTLLFLFGFSGCIICFYLFRLPQSVLPTSNYVTLFGEEVYVFSSGFVFLVYLSIVLLLSSPIRKIILIALGILMLYLSIHLQMINICIDGCGDVAYNAILTTAIKSLWTHYYIPGLIFVSLLCITDLLIKHKYKSKSRSDKFVDKRLSDYFPTIVLVLLYIFFVFWF